MYSCIAVPSQKLPANCQPKEIGWTAQTNAGGSDLLDLSQAVQNGQIDCIQSVFIDASECSANVILTSQGTGQRIMVQSGKQGWFPILASNPPRFTAQCAVGAGYPVFNFLNVPMPAGVW